MNAAHLFSPVVDRDGLVVTDARGVPLAADPGGIVYTLQDDGDPAVLGALAETMDGNLVIADVRGLSALAGLGELGAMGALGELGAKAKGQQLIDLARRRAHARSRYRVWQGRLTRLRGQHLAEEHPDIVKAKARSEHWKQRWTSLNDRMGQLNAEALKTATLGETAADDAAMQGLAEADAEPDIAGLGSFGSFWKKNSKLIGGVAAGAAGAGIIGAAATPGTGANAMVGKLWKGAKGFFTKGDQAEGADVVAAAGGGRGKRGARGGGAGGAAADGGSPALAQAGFGGMSMKTLLLIGGIGLGALLLLKKSERA